MIREEQLELRRKRAREGNFRIDNVGRNRVFSEYRVTNPDSGGAYSVQIRGFSVGDNQCECPDFKSNTLGTCKHIEAVLDSLKDELPVHVVKKKAVVTRPVIYLHYGESLKLGIHLPQRSSDKLTKLVRRYFTEAGIWSGHGDIVTFHEELEKVPEVVTVMTDALDFIDREVDRAALRTKEVEWLKQLDSGTLDLQPLGMPLYDYQLRGALFLACRGRSILGDDMGLGKTIQTLAAVEILARERGVSRVLVVAPSSVKYQWETEIRKFTPRAVQVVDGGPEDRIDQYAEPTFYRLVNYEQVVRDREAINQWRPDVIVLDEAQRIKNWESKTSREVKKLKSRYAFVLTGTPLENKLEELYSIVQFVDERHFGPAFQFLHDHRLLDSDGNLVGYRKLDAIREKLAPIFLRRTRAEVLTQLPARTDSTVYVELAEGQKQLYEEQKTALARLLAKGYLTEIDRKRILAHLTNLRMICDSTFLYDPETNVSPKLDEFAEVIPELSSADRKVVVFSQWETMISKVAELLEERKMAYVLLHGGLSGKERKAVLDRFQKEPDCRFFLSTDAGGTGLNLQVADTVVNLELPWNPAILEQRVARVHRMGQKKPVRNIAFVTRGTVEERVLKVLNLKRNLFEGLFSGDEDELPFTSAKVANVVKVLMDDDWKEPAPTVPETSHSPELVLASVQLLDSLRRLLTLSKDQLTPEERQKLGDAALTFASALQPEEQQ